MPTVYKTRPNVPSKMAESKTYEDVLLVLFLDGCNDPRSNHGLLPCLGQVKVENTISCAIVNVVLHLRVAVLSANVHLSRDHVDDVFVLISSEQQRHILDVRCFRLNDVRSLIIIEQNKHSD